MLSLHIEGFGILTRLKQTVVKCTVAKSKSQSFPESSSSLLGNFNPGQEGHSESEFAEMSENDRETKKQKEDALKESRAGNDAREEKDFDAAIKHYSKAMELDDEDILYIIDRAAVYFEMRKV